MTKNKTFEYDYLNDNIANLCLKYSENCKSDISFGAVLIKNNEILGYGWNRLSTKFERKVLTHVDYAIHAEQAALFNALLRFGKEKVKNSTIYVLGKVTKGTNKGKLTLRKKGEFLCSKCPNNFKKYNVNVNVPAVSGWTTLTADEALITGKNIKGKFFWKNFIKGKHE